MSSRQTIAVDIDDVLSINVPAFVEYSNKKWGTNLKVEDFLEDWATMWGLDHAETKKRAQHLDGSHFVFNHEVVEGASEVLKHLAEHYKLVVATSRRKVLTGDTTQWIDKYFQGVFEEVHYAGIWDTYDMDAHLITKADLVKQIGADYLIDDQPKHCFAVADAGITAILFGDYPWNQIQVPKEIVRAKDWQAVKEYFDAPG